VISDHNHAVALRCAAAGLSIFPVGTYTKRPLIKWRAGSTTSAAQISAFWNRWPGALGGVDLAKCGLVVFDADRHAGAADGVAAFAALLRKHNTDLSAVPIIHTPSNGFHFYFRQPTEPLGNREGDLPDGINVRGSGGFVVAPLCVRPDGKSYRNLSGHPTLLDAFRAGTIPVVPDWLVAIVRPAQRFVTYQRANYTLTTTEAAPVIIRTRAWALSALERCTTDLARCPNGQRNNTLNAVAYRLGRIVARGWLDRTEVEGRLHAAAQGCGLIAQDGARSVASTIRSGLNAGGKLPVPDLR
jgi:hypothetical protein